MVWLLLSSLALAGPADRPLARVGETLEEHLYARVDLDDEGRASPRWRRRSSGDFRVWHFADDVVVRYTRSEGGSLVEEHRFDAGGWPLTSTTFGESGEPRTVRVHLAPPVELVVASWQEQVLEGLTLRAPVAPEPREGGGWRLTVEGGSLELWRVETEADVLSEGFRDGLLAGCGCTVIERATSWIDGRAGVRYRLGLGAGRLADLWAVPDEGGAWLISYQVSPGGEPWAALAPGRAAIALLRWTEQEAP